MSLVGVCTLKRIRLLVDARSTTRGIHRGCLALSRKAVADFAAVASDGRANIQTGPLRMHELEQGSFGVNYLRSQKEKQCKRVGDVAEDR